MSHLTLEDFARLVDEEPTAPESHHLLDCARCAAELRELRDQTAALGELPPIEPAAAAWPRLERRLGSERLIRTARPSAGAFPGPGVLRIAAAVALLLTGAAAGYAARGTAEPAPAAGVAAAWSAAPASLEEASLRVRLAEAEYVDALERYNRLTTSESSADPMARLAALHSIVLTTRAALNDAPADPLINGYHLTALSQRDAVLEQLALTEDPWF